MAAELLGAKGLGLLRWSSRRMLRVPDAEEERGGIAVGSEKRGGADQIEVRRRRRRSGGGGTKARALSWGLMDPIEKKRGRKTREQRRVWGWRASGRRAI